MLQLLLQELEPRRLLYGPGDVIGIEESILRVSGDDGANEIVVRLNDDGAVEALVDGQAVATEAHVTFLRVRGGDGGDVIRIENVTCRDGILVNAGHGDDEVFGTDAESELAFADTLKGGPGNDTITGGAQPDRILGGNGNDLIVGGGRTDHIFGGYGDDEIHGGGGEDELYGGEGDDTLFGDRGADLMAGQDGRDRFPDREEEDRAFHTNPENV